MAKGFSFEEALGKPSASQEAPKGFSFEEALGNKPAPVEVETPAPVPVAEPAEPAPRSTDAGQIDYGFKNTAGAGRGKLGGPTAEELDIDQMSQFRKGLQAGWVALKSIPANLELSGGAQAFVNATNRLSMLDKIDSGEITSVRQVRQEPGFNPLIGSYLASGPEVRARIRNHVLKEITNDQDFVKNAIEAVEQYQAEAKKYTGRTEDLTDVRSAKNFGDWLAKASGEGAVQLAPVMLAALTLKAPGVLASSSAMEYGGGVQNRLEFLANRVKNLSPDQKASVVANYIEETDDVTAAAAIMSGSLDVILGPAATAAKMSAKRLLETATRKGAMKQAAKKAPKDIAGEFTTGAGQEAIQIGAEKELGEQQDVLNMKNVKRVINSAAKEAAGAPTGTAINVAMAGARKPSLDTGKESDLIKGLDKEGEELDKKDKGGQDDAGTVSPAGGAGVQVAGQPGGVSTAAGAGVSEPAGVDVAGQDVAGAEGRTSEQPGALTGEPIVGNTFDSTGWTEQENKINKKTGQPALGPGRKRFTKVDADGTTHNVLTQDGVVSQSITNSPVITLTNSVLADEGESVSGRIQVDGRTGNLLFIGEGESNAVLKMSPRAKQRYQEGVPFNKIAEEEFSDAGGIRPDGTRTPHTTTSVLEKPSTPPTKQPGALTEAELEAAAEREAIQAESQQQAAPIDDSDIPDTDFQRKEPPSADTSTATRPNPLAPNDPNSWQDSFGHIHYKVDTLLPNGKSQVTELIDQEQSQNVALKFTDSKGNPNRFLSVSFTGNGTPYWSMGEASEETIRNNIGENLFNAVGTQPVTNTQEYQALVQRIKSALEAPAAPSEAPTDVSRETPATTTPASTTAKTELQRLEQNLQDAERTLKEFRKKEGPDFFKDEDAYDAHQEEEERLKKAVEEAGKTLYEYKNSNAFAVTTGLQPAPASTTQKFKFSNREDFDNVVDEDTGELYPGYNYFAAFTEGSYVYPGSFVVINNAKDAETAKSNGMSFFSEKQKTVAELEAEIAKLKGQRDKLLTPTGKEPKTGTKKAADWDALTRQIEDRWAQISGLESGRTAEPATAPAALPAPITVASESRGEDNFGNATTDITLSNGSKYQIQRLNSTESMGLPGWHLAGATTADIRAGAFLGNTKAEAVQELIRRETQRQQQAPLLTNEPSTIDVESRVVSDAVNNNLAPEDLRRLTAHYGLSPNSEKFIERVKADIVRFANEGAQAVAAAIRDIIQKLHAGVLSVALIFNPTNITSPEFAFYPSYTRSTTTEVLAEVPAAAAEKMSPEAKRAYQVLYPSIKDQLIKNNKFMVIADKQSARIFVFRPDGSLLLEKKSLFGLAKGDMYKGNTDLPQNRITPAGLFTMGLRDATRSASEARTAGEYDFKKVFVLDKAIDGEYSVTLFHSVWLHESDAAARARALQSESAEDSRYSFGCINVDKSTYKYLIDNHLQQMDGASLFIVPDDPANLASMLSGKPKAGDELTRTEFTPATETKTETVPLQQAGTKPSSTVMDADRRRTVLNSITANATKSTASVAPNIADLVRANMTGIRRLIAEYRAGRLTAEQFADQMLRLQERITTEGDIRRNAALNRVRGADRVMEALLQAKRQGRISAETADFALWFLSQNPAMATNLGISISIPKNRTAQRNLENTAGFYSPFAQLVRIVTQRDPETGQYSETNPDTAVHEILHHIERMLPDNIRKMIRNEWSKQVKAELKKATARNDTNAIRYLELVLYANAAKDETAAFAAGKMVKDGDVPEFMYALFDPSEFWAVRGSDLLAGRYGAHTRFARAKQFIKEFIQTVKGVFGLQSDSPILKGLESALRGDGTFVSRRMLNEGSIFTNVQQIAPKGLHSDVADAINRNDITGAMKAMARNTSGFYSALADRLAALNLPTSIGFNNQRALVRKIIDDRSAQQQLRLFAYLSREAPTFYDQYFKDYDKVENLERVAEGLSLIETAREGFTARNINTAPVATELAAVREAYRRNMPGLTAPGFFAPTLDTVNIRPDRTLGTNNRVVLHEVVHAATEYMLYGEVRNLTQEQQDAVADLNAMYKFAQTKLSPDEYGFTNLSEFVAEVMTNKDFQNKLKAIPYPPRKTTLLGAFKQLIGRMFGFNNLAGAAMSAIDDIMSPQRPTSGVRAGPLKFATSGKKKRVRGPVSKPDTSRTAESVDRTIMDVVSDASQGKQSIGSAISDLKGALWSASGGAVRAVMLPVLQLRQLKDLTRSKFPQFAGAVRIVEQMVAYRGEKIRTAEEIVKRWGQLQSKSPQQSDLMSRIMIEATIRGRDPDAGVAPGALPDALDNAWNGLDTEFQEIYRDVRQFYADSVEEMVRTMKQRALGLPKAQRQAMIRKINEQFGPKKLAYPYFPLRRFGTHWLQVGKGPYKEFYTFDNPVSRQLAFYQRRRELQGGNAQQRALAETMRMGNGISELFSQNMSATQAIKELEETLNNLTSTDVAGIKEEIKDSMHQLVYLLLPQQSMRKMFINRKAIQGMSSDMLRVFAHSAVHSAYQQARFKYAEPFINNISNARSYIQDMEESKAITPEQGSVYRDYVLELEKRVSNVLGVEDKSMAAKVGNTIASTVFYWMLSAPASALINIVGASQITMPYIGGRYGYAKTNATMLKYLGLYIASTPTRSLAPMVKGQFSQVSFPSIVESGFVSKMDPMIQRAAQRLIADGDINISMTNDIFDLSEMPSALYTGKINTVKKVLSGVFHQAERLNREVSMLTAFELAFERYNGADKRDIRGVVERDSAGNPIKYTPDEAFEKALEDARDIGGLTLGDFSRQMKGRVFQHPGINLITQFKQYAITATYAVLRNFYLTVGAPFKTAEIEQFRKQMIADKVAPAVVEQRIEEAEKFRKEVYREGMKRLAGILGMTFLFGGIVAQPFFNMLGQLIAMFAPDGDDKDEYFDWQNWFYNYMQSEVGGAAAAIFEKMGMKAGKAKDAGEELGMALARGPVAALTGTSLAERVSLDLKNLWWKDLPYSNELKQDFEKAALELLGPFVGLGTNWTQAWDLATKGQYQRAFEKALPAIASKPVTAARLGTEGATDMKGATIMGLYADQFSSWELAMQALGFQPEKLARAMKAASQVKAKEAKIHNERAAILDRLYLERGTDEYADVYEKARDFSIRYPQLKIDDTVISDAFEERDRARVEAEAKGVRIDKKLYPELGPMTNYGWGNR